MYSMRQLCLRPRVHFELQLLQDFKTCHVSHLSPPLPQFDGVTLQVTPPTAPAQGLLGRCLLQPHQLHHGHLQAVAQPIPGTWSVVMAEAIRRTTGLLWLVGHNVSCAVIGWSHGQPRAPLGLGQASWSQGKKKKRLKQKAEAKQNICFFPSKVMTQAISYYLSEIPMPCHWIVVFYLIKLVSILHIRDELQHTQCCKDGLPPTEVFACQKSKHWHLFVLVNGTWVNICKIGR